MKYKKFKNTAYHQTGLSLIELMISMVVGLFLLAGVVTNFIGTKDADHMRDAISNMDANANEALTVLRTTISHAGYSSMENIRLDKPFYTASDGEIKNENSCRNGLKPHRWKPPENRRTRDLNVQDRITVVSLADNPCRDGATSCPNMADVNPNALHYTDCLGNGGEATIRDTRAVYCSTDPDIGMPDPTQAKIYSTFRIIRNPNVPTRDRGLFCEGSRTSGHIDTKKIADNVEAMQFLYGVRQENGNTSYRTANQVEEDDQWGMVTSVQVGLLMRSENQYLLKQPSTKNVYRLLKQPVTIANDDLRRLFKIYTTTINLENVDNGALL
ncbi:MULTISPECIES: PilW family protein [unclassified Cocleimonas]|uniref:PilW family protein n=1 Tax=unclassified Cocleimonas TaxID=2639732 RepID=UPI002DB6C416|nr:MULTISPECIES: PilW family protein [unclassified Cocleimonas]MEC4745671.1 PilW family protein [Cocleimonas sp. KMM 6896]